MSKTDEWMPFYIGRYLGDTMHLTYEQHGPYVLLLMHYWRKGPLPNDDRKLAAIARVPLDVWLSGMSETIREFFTLAVDGQLHQKRQDEEREKRGTISKARAAAGRKGGLAPRSDAKADEQTPSKLEAIASDLLQQTGSMVQVQEQEESPPSEVADATPPKAAQGNLLPPDPPPPSPEPAPTAKQRLWSEGLPLLAGFASLNQKRDRPKLGAMMGEMDRLVQGDHERLLGILRDTKAKAPLDPMSWVWGCVRGHDKPRVVVNNDPSDAWGIKAWCAALPDAKPAETENDRRIGKWILGGLIIDGMAKTCAKSAYLPETWRGDWSALAGWARDRIREAAIVEGIQRVVDRDSYDAREVRSMALFDRAVREAHNRRFAA